MKSSLARPPLRSFRSPVGVGGAPVVGEDALAVAAAGGGLLRRARWSAGRRSILSWRVHFIEVFLVLYVCVSSFACCENQTSTSALHTLISAFRKSLPWRLAPGSVHVQYAHVFTESKFESVTYVQLSAFLLSFGGPLVCPVCVCVSSLARAAPFLLDTLPISFHFAALQVLHGVPPVSYTHLTLPTKRIV